MAWFIRIDALEDLEWMKRIIDSAVIKATRTEPARFELHEVETFLRLQTAFNEAVEAFAADFSGGRRSEETRPMRLTDPAPEPKGKAKGKAKRKRKTAEELSEAKRLAANLCPDHRNYAGLRHPRTDCQGCWDAYRKYSGEAKYRLARIKFERANSKGAQT